MFELTHFIEPQTKSFTSVKVKYRNQLEFDSCFVKRLLQKLISDNTFCKKMQHVFY
jgi:hypothetical protein